jgi:phage terminase large subunit GpA-like protein
MLDTVAQTIDRAARGRELRAEFSQLPHGRKVLFDAMINASTREQDLTVSEWSDRYRKVSAESGSRYPGDWITARVPYLREPMDCLHPDHPARSVRLKFSAQTGKSEVGVCWFGFIVDQAPGSLLTILPSLDEALKYNRVKLQPTIDASPRIRHRVRPENSRDEAASTTAFKRFAGGFNQIVTASSSKGLQMISVRYLIMEEVSEYPLDTDGRGSPIDQARARQKSYGDMAKEFVPSTPGIAGECRISQMYDEGDRRRCYLPCPHCGAFQVLRFENMQPPSVATNNRATFGCIANGCIIDQAEMPDMRLKLRWVPTRVEEGEPAVPVTISPAEIDVYAIPPCEGRVRQWHPSYALWSAYSPFESWGDIFARWLDAKGDPLKEKVFTQQDLGEAYEASSDTPDWEKLLAVRRPWRQDVVPFPACVLTGFIDVQGNRFEWGVWGYGPGFQAWMVARGVIAHGYETDAAWKAIDALTARTWPTESCRELTVLRWGIDTGAFTQTLYDRVSGRHLLLATKGDNRPRSIPFRLTRADLRDAQGRPIAGRRINLGLIGNFDLKSSVYEGLRHLVVGCDAAGRWPQGTVHLPDWIGEDELKQLTAETLVDPRLETKGNAKAKALVRPGDTREWRKRPNQANEALDIAVGCRALAWGEGAGQISATRWQELVAEAHGPVPAPAADLFAPPKIVSDAAPETIEKEQAEPVKHEDIIAKLARLAKLNAERW